jgi:hypothetical protein
MNPPVENEVPADKVGARVKLWMINDPPPRTITIETDGDDTYKITVVLKQAGPAGGSAR